MQTTQKDIIFKIIDSLLKYMDITKLVSKCVRGMNEQLLKTSGADVLSSRGKNSEKTYLWMVGGRASTTPPPHYVRGLIII